ncbi:hypothetical protein NC652_037975 [Populus alba x Populus x berolinensis]|nr:hypothetical protein NC652_037975 [Populus alba x Populus x berolinensis]
MEGLIRGSVGLNFVFLGSSFFAEQNLKKKEIAKACPKLVLEETRFEQCSCRRELSNKSDIFIIDLLVSRLHSVHKSRYLVGSVLGRRANQLLRSGMLLIPYP